MNNNNKSFCVETSSNSDFLTPMVISSRFVVLFVVSICRMQKVRGKTNDMATNEGALEVFLFSPLLCPFAVGIPGVEE